MWYKLTFGQQLYFLIVIGWLPIAFVLKYLAMRCIDGYSYWMGLGGLTDYKDKPGTKTYNCGNPNNTGQFVTKPSQHKQTFSDSWKRKQSVTGLLDGEREMPPRAHFFGRLDGKPVKKYGRWHVELLNCYEKQHWLSTQGQKPAVKPEDTEIGSKIAGIIGKTSLQQQNLDTARKMGLFEGKNAENGQNTEELAKKTTEKPQKGFELVVWEGHTGTWYLDGRIALDKEFIKRIRLDRVTGLHVGEVSEAYAGNMRAAEEDALVLDEELDLTEGFVRAMGRE